MQDRFKFRAVLKTDKFTILVEPFYILNSCYFIDINKAEVEFKCKYPDECFWDFIEEIEKQDYIQEISIDGDLIITNDFTNLIQCTGSNDDKGKLMYEGDIVKIWKFSKDLYSNDKRVIKWNNARCGFRLYTIDQYKRGIELSPQSMVNATTIEVIGNIFQNPELLKDGE